MVFQMKSPFVCTQFPIVAKHHKHVKFEIGYCSFDHEIFRAPVVVLVKDVRCFAQSASRYVVVCSLS